MRRSRRRQSRESNTQCSSEFSKQPPSTVFRRKLCIGSDAQNASAPDHCAQKQFFGFAWSSGVNDDPCEYFPRTGSDQAVCFVSDAADFCQSAIHAHHAKAHEITDQENTRSARVVCKLRPLRDERLHSMRAYPRKISIAEVVKQKWQGPRTFGFVFVDPIQFLKEFPSPEATTIAQVEHIQLRNVLAVNHSANLLRLSITEATMFSAGKFQQNVASDRRQFAHRAECCLITSHVEGVEPSSSPAFAERPRKFSPTGP